MTDRLVRPRTAAVTAGVGAVLYTSALGRPEVQVTVAPLACTVRPRSARQRSLLAELCISAVLHFLALLLAGSEPEKKCAITKNCARVFLLPKTIVLKT